MRFLDAETRRRGESTKQTRFQANRGGSRRFRRLAVERGRGHDQRQRRLLDVEGQKSVLTAGTVYNSSMRYALLVLAAASLAAQSFDPKMPDSIPAVSGKVVE